MPITPDTIDRETKDYLMRIYKAMGFRITPIEFLQLYCYAYNELERMGDPDPKTNAIQLMDSLDPSLSYSELKAELEGKLILREYPAVSEEMEELEELRKRVKELEEELAKARRYEYIDELQEIRKQLRKLTEEVKKLKQMRLPVERRAEERTIQKELKTLRDEIISLREELTRRPPIPPIPVVTPFPMGYDATEYIQKRLDELDEIVSRMYGYVPDEKLRKLGEIIMKSRDILNALSMLGETIFEMRYRLAYRDELRRLKKEWEETVNQLQNEGYIKEDLANLLKAHYTRTWAELMTL